MRPLRKLVSTCLSTASLLLLAACGGGSGGDDEPRPPATPPTLSLSASRTTVIEGKNFALSWMSTGASSCTASGGWSGNRALSGREIIRALAATATFTLSCRGAGGAVAGSVTVTVEPAPPAPNNPPEITGFQSSDSQVPLGTEIVFSWTAQDADGDQLRCVLDVTGVGPEIVIDDCAGTRSEPYTHTQAGIYLPQLRVADAETTVAVAGNQAVTSNFFVDSVAPHQNTLVDALVAVRTRVRSPLEISGVFATIEGRTVELRFVPATGTFEGTLSIAGLPEGEKFLHVEARDIAGTTANFIRRLIYDLPAELVVAEPVAQSVARPTIRIAATCTDSTSAACEIRVYRDKGASLPNLVRGEGAIDTVVDLSSYDGRQLDLLFRALDSGGQATDVVRRVYVDGSDTIEPVADLPGLILDLAGDRVLYLESSAPGDALAIWNRSDDSFEAIPVAPDRRINERMGLLAPNGAIFVSSDLRATVGSNRVEQWNGATLVDLGSINSSFSLKVAGRYAIYNQGATLLRRDLVSDITGIVTNAAGNIDNDVTDDGTIAFWNQSHDIELVQNGVSTLLTNDADLRNSAPLTDGTRAVYRKYTPCCVDESYAIALHDELGETLLRQPTDDQPQPGRHYQIVPDWVAYTDLGNVAQTHVWLHGPTGDSRQITFFGTDSTIDRLTADGMLTIRNGQDRYLAHPDGSFTRVSSGLGESHRAGDQWYVTIGRTLFRVIQ